MTELKFTECYMLVCIYYSRNLLSTAYALSQSLKPYDERGTVFRYLAQNVIQWENSGAEN